MTTIASTLQWKVYDQFQNKPRQKLYYHSINHNVVSAHQSISGYRRKTAIDVAAGCGTSTYPLLSVAETVIGVDSSQYLIDIALQHNDHPNVRFVCSRVEDFDPGFKADLVSASWLLNYSHTESELLAVIAKLHSLLNEGGCISLVVPSAAFFSPQVQRLARDDYEFEVASLEVREDSTVGVFSYSGEWIKTTMWQPIHLIRLCSPWFELHEWDVKGTLVRDGLLPELKFEPPYSVIFGRAKKMQVRA